MYFREFESGIYVTPLIVSVGMDYDYLVKRFVNKESDDWGKPENLEIEAAFGNLVADKEDYGKFKILLNFNRIEEMTMRNIVHECFHVAISICKFHNMSLGFNIGEDEHAAYIAGWAGNCVGEVWNDVSKKEDNKNGSKKKNKKKDR